ncbi:MAG: hypothetical protein KY412_00635, partial [Actinobacteria bacterium]|nr:hypothetical protein [Actinomycetota bacterium]
MVPPVALPSPWFASSVSDGPPPPCAALHQCSSPLARRIRCCRRIFSSLLWKEDFAASEGVEALLTGADAHRP